MNYITDQIIWLMYRHIVINEFGVVMTFEIHVSNCSYENEDLCSDIVSLGKKQDVWILIFSLAFSHYMHIFFY